MNLEPFTFVLERVGQLLIDDIKLLSTDKKELLGRLQEQVELTQSFVRDVEDEKRHTTISHVLQTEVKHIMEILPRIEDFLDAIHFEEEAEESQSELSPFKKLKASVSNISKHFFNRRDVLNKASQLIKDLEDVRQRALPYQHQSTNPQVTQRRRPLPQTQPHIMNEEFIVGLGGDVKALVAKLLGKDTTILAVVGMGGSGKTTLTRKLYNHQEIKKHFRNQAWVCVSKEWDTYQLLHQMCVQLHVRLTEGDISVAGFKLREFLQTSSCFVVLDDVWEITVLQELLPLLLSGGGAVVVTTRNEEILIRHLVRGSVYIHKARALTPDQSWELFSKIVRNEWQGVRYFDEESVFAKSGKNMLKKCHGLPLAIVALAGLLSTKDSIQEWETVKINVSSRILKQNKGFLDYGPVKYMIELSYLDLPYVLKPCFLYLGIFPEDSMIDVGDLIQLWISEGLLRPDLCHDCQSLEELGIDVVNELVQRCMVQAVCRDYIGKVDQVHVHDLMRDLCIEKARELGFFNISSPSTVPANTMDLMSRRVIIPKDRHSYPISGTRMRSIIKFSKYGERSIKLETLYESMRLLCVLDLEKVDLRNSKVHIGNLILLRHLRIWRCDGAMNLVLESVKKLRNLLTFKFCSKDESVMIPNDMVGNMEHLRYLHLSFYKLQLGGPTVLQLGRSRSLQTLNSRAGEWLCKDLQAASLIYTLRRLTLNCIASQTQLDAISDFVRTPANHLQTLYLTLYDSGLEFDLKRMNLEHCSQLKSLRLHGRIRKQEGPFFFPPNLFDLMLEDAHIEKGEDFGKALAQLHQLRRLMLSTDSYDGDKLTMAGLLQLQRLLLIQLPYLKEWRIEQGALCQLKHLRLWACSKLEGIPKGTSGIHTLQHLIIDMPSRFCKRLEKPTMEGGGGGQDFHLIAHIPYIQIEVEEGLQY